MKEIPWACYYLLYSAYLSNDEIFSGSYSEDHICKKCPERYTTAGTGASSIEQCTGEICLMLGLSVSNCVMVLFLFWLGSC